MGDFIAVIRDEHGNGVRVDRVDGWESRPGRGVTRIFTTGGGIVDLRILPNEFVQRFDRALTAMADGAA